MVLLSLGPAAGIHRILHPFWPPLQLVRNTYLLAPCVLLIILLFYCWGLERFFEENEETSRSVSVAKNARGMFSGAVKEAILLLVAIFLSMGVILAALIWDDPTRYSLVLPLLLLGVSSWILVRQKGASATSWIFLVSQALLVLVFHKSRAFFVGKILACAVFPFLALVLLKKRKRTFGYSTLLVSLFLLPLYFDLFIHAQSAVSLTRAQPNLTRFIGINTRFSAISFPKTRVVVPSTWYGSGYKTQAIRNAELLNEVPAALSSTEFELPLGEHLLEQALASKRWSTLRQLNSYRQLLQKVKQYEVLKECFRIGKSPIQFRHTVSLQESFRLDDCATVAHLDKGPENRSFQLEKGTYNQSFSVQEYSGSRLVLKVQSDKSSILTWADAWDPDWVAWVDDLEVPVYRCDKLFKAVYIPQGETTVTFEYRPKAIIVALILFYSAFILGVGCSLFWRDPDEDASGG